MALHIYDVQGWKQVRIQLLKRILILAQARHSSPGGATRSVSALSLDFKPLENFRQQF